MMNHLHFQSSWRQRSRQFDTNKEQVLQIEFRVSFSELCKFTFGEDSDKED